MANDNLELARALLAAGVPGQMGSQSGPVQESDSAYYERLLQNILGGGMTVGGIGLGAIGGGSMGGIPGAMAGGTLGSLPGANVMHNADSPNIQDVWAHKYMQRLRRGY